MKARSALPVLTVLAAGTAVLPAQEAELRTFRRIQLSDQFWCEGANFADFNNDGKNDIVSGPWWWEGPDFQRRHEIYPPAATFELALGPMTRVTVPGFHGALGRDNAYSDNFFAWPYDFNGDGWTDVLVIGFPGKDASWFENPAGREGHWKRHVVFDGVDNESPEWTDITGDGKPEIICNHDGYFGYISPDWSNPANRWTFQRISTKGGWKAFTHGLGTGDLNGDGRIDILEAKGWFEQPAEGPAGLWIRHEFEFAGGGAQMFAYDVNGDGLNDVITSLNAHAFGLAWYEQVRENGAITFRRHLIMGQKPEDNKYGVKFSELHALSLTDMDGDGLKDIVTGKRFWSHGRMGDPDRNDAAVIYWFRLVRGADGSVDYIPYRMDDNSGVGTQVVAGDVNGDGLPDAVIGNKKGTFVLLQEKKAVSREEWSAAQPKPHPNWRGE